VALLASQTKDKDAVFRQHVVTGDQPAQ
jgi:hypothetical protein